MYNDWNIIFTSLTTESQKKVIFFRLKKNKKESRKRRSTFIHLFLEHVNAILKTNQPSSWHLVQVKGEVLEKEVLEK